MNHHKIPVDCQVPACRATTIHTHPPRLQFFNPKPEFASPCYGYASPKIPWMVDDGAVGGGNLLARDRDGTPTPNGPPGLDRHADERRRVVAENTAVLGLTTGDANAAEGSGASPHSSSLEFDSLFDEAPEDVKSNGGGEKHTSRSGLPSSEQNAAENSNVSPLGSPFEFDSLFNEAPKDVKSDGERDNQTSQSGLPSSEQHAAETSSASDPDPLSQFNSLFDEAAEDIRSNGENDDPATQPGLPSSQQDPITPPNQIDRGQPSTPRAPHSRPRTRSAGSMRGQHVKFTDPLVEQEIPDDGTSYHSRYQVGLAKEDPIEVSDDDTPERGGEPIELPSPPSSVHSPQTDYSILSPSHPGFAAFEAFSNTIAPIYDILPFDPAEVLAQYERPRPEDQYLRLFDVDTEAGVGAVEWMLENGDDAVVEALLEDMPDLGEGTEGSNDDAAGWDLQIDEVA